jgi:hypothetical protein
MINRSIVKKALKQTLDLDKTSNLTPVKPEDFRSCETSMLIFDIFGGEILKTHFKKGWHFYNRINGKRIDFTRSEKGKSSIAKRFEDIPSSPDEIHYYFEKEDYLTFFMRFVRAFEETVGLKEYRSDLIA